MRGEFKLPTKFTTSSNKAVKTAQQKVAVDNNDVYSSPYEIRVRPPAGFVAPNAINNNNNEATPSVDSIVESAPSEKTSTTTTTILRLGRSLNFPINEQSLLPVLTEQEAQLLSRAFNN